MRIIPAIKLCDITEGKLVRGDANLPVKGIMSRCSAARPGLVYFDIVGGKQGDCNIMEAIRRGASGIVLSRHKKNLPFKDPDIPVIAVPKVGEAFWKAVKYYRELHDIPVVGVTGTSGKTTTKEMIASIFRLRWKTLKTEGNMNLPHYVPPHIMRLNRGYEAAVFEIGMNRPGHISKQSSIIQPQVGIITHIGEGHIEHLGNFENVVKEKTGIIEGIPDNGFLLLNADDPSTEKIDYSRFKGKVLYYGLKNKADFNADKISFDKKGTSFTVVIDKQEHMFFIPTFGEHNVGNALASIAASCILGFDVDTIRTGLARYRKPAMRLQLFKGIKNSIVINDAYNANPGSMIAGMEVLTELSRGKTGIAVLGNMLEQGEYAVENHRKVGKRAAELNIDWLVTVGRLAKQIAAGAVSSDKMKIWSFLLKKQAVEFLRKNIPESSVILVKGSRGAYMERVVKELRKKSKE
ncbi:UDP-N-acetylmuramoyl-tripeptide--D-alanyl-D-alanine ligase [Phosphitispora sp. TUW77]|uniref:UDP-N-acetylmuramoyl-tripeptide--D-alanyl-D- alanine ligase n=1 Tax=Phosphitispora sp. TUW77 TaxID=3152361 RepID=UPI003AB8BA62